MCATSFALSATRSEKCGSLKRLIDALCAEKIEAELWVDGSFLTQKMEPGDVDVALSLELAFWGQATPQQRALLSRFSSSDRATRAGVLRDYCCDSYVFLRDIPPGHPDYPGRDMRQYWLRQFGTDRSGNQKGIAVISIPGGVL
jgi:uncharacterized protein DUF6932